jgi:hypothetical protein
MAAAVANLKRILVHGNGASFTSMALTLVDKVLSGTFKKPQPPTPASDGGSKRKRAESGSSAGGNYHHSVSSRRHNSSERLPAFTRGGRGGNPSYFCKCGSGNSGDKRFNKFGDRSSGGTSGGRSGSGGGGGYRSRY